MRMLTGMWRKSCGCCLAIVLAAILAAAGLLFLAVKAARAEEVGPTNEAVLVSDQSPSMWDCDGIGTDPEKLRVDAARLFINYLGADSNAHHRLALLHFGGNVVQIAPLTDLGDDEARRKLAEAAGEAQPIRWTDPLRALREADELLINSGLPGSRRLIVLMTDGLPTPPGVQATEAGMNAYYEEMRAEAASLARADVTLAVVLLSDRSTSCGREVADAWQDRWEALAAMTPDGDLYTADTAADLLPLYHAIVREWTGVAAGSAVSHSTVLSPDEPWSVALPVDADLAGMIVTIWKHDPSTLADVLDPLGQAIARDAPSVTITGQAGQSREEVWRIERPQRGLWQVVLTGEGRVSVWYDVSPLPTPRPTHTPTAAPSATPAPTATRAASPTVSPTPEDTATPEAILSVSDTNADRAEPTGRGRGPWLAVLGGGALLMTGGVIRSASRRQRRHVSGRLAVLSGPAGVVLAPPRDLDNERAGSVILGAGGSGEWQLAGWPGSVRLEPGPDGRVVVVPISGETLVNDQPVARTTPIADGDVIVCGPYRIRYENLLAGGDE